MLITASIFVAAVWLIALGVLGLNLLSLPRVRDPDESSELPSLSVVIPARNEERDIERCVRSLASQDYPGLEVIVVDDQSTDGTPQILAKLGDALPRLRVIAGTEPPEGWLGKPWALQQGGEAARGDLLLFCDADVEYQPGALRRVVCEFSRWDADAITLLPRVEMRGFWEHILMVQLPFTALTLIPLFLSNFVRSPWLAVGGGPGNLLWHETWRAIGTHEALRRAVVDDIALMQLVREHGDRTVLVRANDLVSVRMYRGLREIVRGFSKNSYHAMGGSIPRALVGLAFLGGTQLLPFVLVLIGVVRVVSGGGFDAAHWLALLACGELILSRVILFSHLGYRIDNAVLGQPLMATVWLGIMSWSTWKVGIRRNLEWRGRGYDAGMARFGK